MKKKKLKLKKRLKKDEFKVERVDTFGEEDFFDDCAVCQFEKKAQQSGKPSTLMGLKNSFRKAEGQGALVGGIMFEKNLPEVKSAKRIARMKGKKWMRERGFEYLGTSNDFKIPEWWDCAWRRVPCGKDECHICDKIKQDRLRHMMKGEDTDDMKSVFENAGDSLSGTLAMIKQHAAKMGIDIANINEAELKEPPKPDAFLLYQKAVEWQDEVTAIIKDADLRGNAWLLTEAATDLGWYKNTLLVKIYRQLCNRWHLDRGDEYGEVDYTYTKYALGECSKILEKSLAELLVIGSSQSDGLKHSLNRLQELKKLILSI